jgi:hypothetical protein
MKLATLEDVHSRSRRSSRNRRRVFLPSLCSRVPGVSVLGFKGEEEWRGELQTF